VYKAYKDRYVVLFESHFKRNYIHILDVTRAILHALENYQGMKGSPYNLGLSDANLSKLELCQLIKKHISDFCILESELSSDPDKRDYIVSNKKIENTGWKPSYSLDDGIEELIRAYRFLTVNQHQNM
jgi:nucleoside-diphosphate-sugar epimerase